MLVQMQQRRGTAAVWTSVNPILAEGEEGLETDTGRIKFGNGTDHWSTLPYYSVAPSDAAIEALVANPTSLTRVELDSLYVGGGGGGSDTYFTITGAAGDGVTDDRVHIQAAIDAAKLAGGGTVVLDKGKIYGWTGIIYVRLGVTLQGFTTRQALAPGAAVSVSGMVALSNNAQIRVGDWSGGEMAGGISDVYVDGNFIGAKPGTVAKAGLVRIAGVNMVINNLFVTRSLGDGVVYDGTQNSTIIGCESVSNVGSALVLDNGCGALAFEGGYYGTSKGGSLTCRDTAGEANFYPFGPTNITMDGTIFEAYTGMAAPIAEPYDHHVHVSGTAIVFKGCNFTAGASNTAACTVLVDATATSGIPATATFISCLYWVRQSTDAIRVAGLAVLAFSGQQNVSDDGTHHALSFICCDNTTPHISMLGEVIQNGDTNGTLSQRVIGTGSLAGILSNIDGGVTLRMRLGQVFAGRREGDTGHRFYIDRDGTIAFFTGAAGGTTQAYIQRGAAGAGPGMDFYSAAGGTHKFIGGPIAAMLGLYRAGPVDNSQPALVAADSGYTINAALEATFRLIFFTAATATIAVTGAPLAGGREITIFYITTTGSPTITWPSTFKWAGNAPPAMTAGTVNIVKFRYDSDYSRWFETSRSVGVPYS